MNNLPAQQRGASMIGTIIMLVILGYGLYVGFQYVPQAIEARSVDTILKNVETAYGTGDIDSAQAVQEKVISLLQINEMNDMTNFVTVKKEAGGIYVTFSYDRELNLVYKNQPMHYEKTLRLN